MMVLRQWFGERDDLKWLPAVRHMLLLLSCGALTFFLLDPCVIADTAGKNEASTTFVAEVIQQNLTTALKSFANIREGRDDLTVALVMDTQNVAVDSALRVTVNVVLKFKPRDPAFDTEVRSFALAYVNKRLEHRPPELQGLQPRVRTYVTINNKHHTLIQEFAYDLMLLTAASLSLLLLLLINLIPQSRPRRVVQHIDYSSEPAVENPSARVWGDQKRLQPTEAFRFFQEDMLALPVDPAKGSWYLDALPYVPNASLQHAFETMPFEQAVLMLKTFRKGYRDDVARRLDLSPAVKNRLQ